jgi:hypothetical protein
MSNPTTLIWPFNANSASEPVDVFWGFDQILEMQARLWNHALDANRNLWSAWMPWLQITPWLMNTALAPIEQEPEGEEPAVTADGIPDTLEAQARSWNHALDAYRGFWTSWNWAAPWTAAQAESEAPAPIADRSPRVSSKGPSATPRSTSKQASAIRRRAA